MADCDSAGRSRRRADNQIVAALAGGSTVRKAAERADVSVRTVCRRLKDPAFVERVAAARRSAFGRALAKLSGASTAAAETLRKLLKDEDPGIQLKASTAILTLATRLAETVELEQRIATLESKETTK